MADYRIPNHSSALKDHPEVARLLGIYISTFSMVEFKLLELFAVLMRCDLGVAHIVLHQFNSISHRLTVLAELSEGITGDEDTLEKINSIVTRVKDANGFRNRAAHSLYALKWDSDDLVLVTDATTKLRKPKAIPITPDEFEREIAILERLHEEIEPLLPEALRVLPASHDKAR